MVRVLSGRNLLGAEMVFADNYLKLKDINFWGIGSKMRPPPFGADGWRDENRTGEMFVFCYS
jgi:hypothetical protein